MMSSREWWPNFPLSNGFDSPMMAIAVLNRLTNAQNTFSGPGQVLKDKIFQ
jgi:hypothetical protein